MSEIKDTQVIQFEEALRRLLIGITDYYYYDNDGGDGGDGGGELPIEGLRQRLINYIKAILDELTFDGVSGITFKLSADPNLSNALDRLIEIFLEPSTKDVIMAAPLTSMKPVALTDAGTPMTDTLTGYIALPPAFLRLVSFKMEQWKREAMIISEQHPMYKKQAHRATRGGTAKPVAVMTWKNVGSPIQTMQKVLEYYSVSSSHAVEKLLYIPMQLAEQFISRNPHLMDSLCWTCAAKIMQVTQMLEETKVAEERVVQTYKNL